MSRISIDEIKNILSQDNWVLLSEKYKNLDCNLEFQCNNGHTVIAPWKKIRVNRICPICMRESLKTKEFKNTKKKKEEYRILALDQATYTSGYSVFSNKHLIDFGTFSIKDNDEIERGLKVKQWLISLIEQYQVDFVAIEGIQFQQQIGVTTFETLARLQGILAVTCLEENIPYKIIPTNTWRSHCGVSGRSRVDKKRSMQRLVKEWFDIQPTEDECDAIGIGKYISDIYTPKVQVVDWE